MVLAEPDFTFLPSYGSNRLRDPHALRDAGALLRCGSMIRSLRLGDDACFRNRIRLLFARLCCSSPSPGRFRRG